MEIGLQGLVTGLLIVSIIGIAYVYGFNLETGSLLDNISAAVRAGRRWRLLPGPLFFAPPVDAAHARLGRWHQDHPFWLYLVSGGAADGFAFLVLEHALSSTLYILGKEAGMNLS